MHAVTLTTHTKQIASNLCSSSRWMACGKEEAESAIFSILSLQYCAPDWNTRSEETLKGEHGLPESQTLDTWENLPFLDNNPIYVG